MSETNAYLWCCYWLREECEKKQARLSFVSKNAEPPSRPLLLLTGLNLPGGHKPTFHWQTYAPQERNLFRSHNFDIKGHPRCECAVISGCRGNTIEHISSQLFCSFLYLLAAPLGPQSIGRDQNWQRWIMRVTEDVMETLTHHNLSPSQSQVSSPLLSFCHWRRYRGSGSFHFRPEDDPRRTYGVHQSENRGAVLSADAR